MEKILEAIKSIIRNSGKISEVNVSQESPNDEYFFLFANKYKWSVLKDSQGVYRLYYYLIPELSIQDIAAIPVEALEVTQFVAYSSKEYANSEVLFKELFELVKNKHKNIDVVLDDIIKEGDVPF